MTISEQQLSLIGITGVVSDAADIPPVLAGSEYSTGPAPRGKLSEGWHDTEKYGPIFVSPSGKAWGVQIIGTKLENVIVDVSVRDFIGPSAIEKRKESARKAARRQSTQGQRTKPPILTVGAVSKANDWVLESS